MELRKSYGPEKSGSPGMRWEKLELLPGKNRAWWMAVIHDCDDEYSLLVNLKRLYELQLSRQISIESLHKDLTETFKNFRSDESWNNLYLPLSPSAVPCLNYLSPS